MGEDKDQAVMQEELEHKERISESTLHEVALIGGFPGIIAGAKVFGHKTSKVSFWPPVGASVVLWAVLLFYLAQTGLLPI
jgi:uncharacterized membrane protein YsdA (DUF1294 family)